MCLCVLLVVIPCLLLFADAGTGIFLHAALQYNAQPKTERVITVLSANQ